MLNIYVDPKYKFYELFNTENGFLFRSNIEGKNEEAFQRSFPELLDIGIMGTCHAAKEGFCIKAGIDCYQSGHTYKKHDMSYENYEWIINQCKSKTFQIALGGRGDPNKHKDFEKILSFTRNNNIVPNLTTSGYRLNEEEVRIIKKYCGAVAVSYYSTLINGRESNEVTINAINLFCKYNCLTNIHYVVSKENIEECIFRLENEIWPLNINAIVFLLYKPVGEGHDNKKLNKNDTLKKFLDLAINRKHRYKIGFDTCFASALQKYEAVDSTLIDECEAGRFSMYIDSELKAYPCSFGSQRDDLKIQLNPTLIQDAWESEIFAQFRTSINDRCSKCKYNNCHAGCGLNLDLCLH